MDEHILVKMHEGMLFLYAFSLLFYYIDFLENKKRIKKLAFVFLVIVWFLQTLFFVLYMIEQRRFPVLTLAEGLYFYSWLLLTLAILFSLFVKIEFIVFFSAVLGFITVVIYTFAPFRWQSPSVMKKLTSELLFFHITLSLAAYVLFSISFILSLLYILQYHMLKRKKWKKQLFRIQDLSKLEHFSYRFNIIGIPLLATGLVLGLQWLVMKMPAVRFYDWKITGSLLILFVYGIYVFLKLKKGLHGKKLALWNIAAFLLVLINFFLFSKLSSFHFWYA